MSIKRGGENVIPHRDSWINIDSSLYHGLCSRGLKFSHVSGTRCYYYTNPDDSTQLGYCYLKSVRFICDSWRESEDLYLVSWRHVEMCNRALAGVKAEHEKLIENLMAGKPLPKQPEAPVIQRRMRLRGQP